MDTLGNKSFVDKTMDSITKLNPFRKKTVMEDSEESISKLNPFNKKSIVEEVQSKIEEVNPFKKNKSEEILESMKSPFKESDISSKMMNKLGQGETDWKSWAIRLLLLFIILALLSANILAYLNKGTDLFSSKLRGAVTTGGKSIFDTIEKGFDNTIDGTTFSTGVFADSVKSVLNLFRGFLLFDNSKKDKKEKKDKKDKKD